MKPTDFPGREYYKPSGLVQWAAFLPWLFLALAAASALAGIMFWLFKAGHSYIIIMPAIAALAVGGCVKLAVGKGLCRNRAVAAVAGIGAGIFLYLGYYYCGMVYHLGAQTAGRLDLLPSYIRIRMHVDVLRDAHDSRHDDEANPKRGNVYLNWGVFGFESLMVLSITTGAGLSRARKPFCEACGKWMLREVTHFDPAQATRITEALRTGSAQSLATLAAEPAFATVPSIMLAAEFCPSLKEGVGRGCPVYVSLKNITKTGGGGGVLDPFDGSPGKVLLRSLWLSPDETSALARRFPVFGSSGGSTAPAGTTAERAMETGRIDYSAAHAPEIRPVGTEFAGKVLTKRNALIGTLLSLAALVLLFAGLGLAAWGGMTAFPDDKSRQPVSPETKTIGIAALSVGLALFASTAVFFLVNPSYFGNRWFLKVVKHEFARRTGSLVDANDPEALFVEVVPKLTWGKMMLDNASDVGFLRVDKARREVLFEGDKERWRIPGAAVTSSEVEYFVQGQGTHAATKIYYTVLRVQHPTQFWEAPIRERTGLGLFRSRRRKRSAERLSAAIRAIRSVERSPASAV